MVLDRGMALGKACDRAVPGMGLGPASSYWRMRWGDDDLCGLCRSPFDATTALTCTNSSRCEVPKV